MLIRALAALGAALLAARLTHAADFVSPGDDPVVGGVTCANARSFACLLGRTGGQTLIGGLTSADSLTIYPHTGAGIFGDAGAIILDGQVTLWPDAGFLAANVTQSLISFTTSMGTFAGGDTLREINLSPTATIGGTNSNLKQLIAVYAIPTVTVTKDDFNYYAVEGGGTFENQSTSVVNQFFRLFYADVILESATASAPPMGPLTLDVRYQLKNFNTGAGVNVGTVAEAVAVIDESQLVGVAPSSGTNAMTVTNWDTVLSKPAFSGVSATATITATARHALWGKDVGGVGTGATVSNNWGSLIEALTTGTQNFQYGAGEMAASSVGTVPSGYGIFGVESGNPNRFFFKNENGNFWEVGYTTFHGFTTGTISTSVATFFAMNGNTTTTSGTETSVVPRIRAPGASHLIGMACTFNAAPNGAGKSYAIVPMDNGSAVTNTTCTISNAATSCSVFPATTDAVAAADPLTIRLTPAGTPTAPTAVSCATFYTIDAF
jgi:hypothetical protein